MMINKIKPSGDYIYRLKKFDIASSNQLKLLYVNKTLDACIIYSPISPTTLRFTNNFLSKHVAFECIFKKITTDLSRNASIQGS